jgi:predicted DNA binding CopG/RHH family protein
MKYFELDKNEEKVVKDFEGGALKRVADLPRQKTVYQSVAKNTLNKTRHINVRLSERDLQKLKACAAEKGVPYQTLVTSILHQYSNGRVEEKV